MSAVRIVVHLVRCTQSLLLCDDINTDHLRFRDAAECSAALPALIAAYEKQDLRHPVVMGRCRFMPPAAPDRTPVQAISKL